MEPIKKTYKPKEENVKKVKKLHNKLKKKNPIECHLFTAKIIFLLVLFSGCSANWHLKKAIGKNPSLVTPQIVVVDTFTVTDSFVSKDTFVTSSIDTVTVENERFKTVVIRTHDTLKIHTLLKPDSVFIEIPIEVPPVIKYEPLKVPPWLWIMIVIMCILVLIKVFRK